MLEGITPYLIMEVTMCVNGKTATVPRASAHMSSRLYKCSHQLEVPETFDPVILQCHPAFHHIYSSMYEIYV